MASLRNEVLRILESVSERHYLFSVRAEAKRLLATCLALLDKGGTEYDYHADP
ncbi:MAG: hypothetical protein HY000_38290 [Planctomycetes bacterium]|nr:hypothetical protein [Planctomycetota bacterium]